MIVALVATLLATKLLGWVAQKARQPAVVGELLAGVLLGASVLGILDPAQPTIHLLAEIGVVLLLFAIGLETELGAMLRVGPAATAVAVAGVALPMALGYFASTALGLSQPAALVCGAALCATSVGITARVLSQLGWLDTTEGRVILGAAVIDDVIGIVILAVVASVVSGRSIGESLSSASGLIILAFAAGAALNRVRFQRQIVKVTTLVGHVFVPIFFAATGAAVELRALADPSALLLGGTLIACGVVGKLVAGIAPWWMRGDKLLIGIGMVPRGEVGLVFAQMGLAAGAVNAGEYGALMLMVLATTFITPTALAWRAKRVAAPGTVGIDRPGEGGVDDLVSGTSPDS